MAQDAIITAPPEVSAIPIRFRVSEDGLRAYLDLSAGEPEAVLRLEDFERAWKDQGFDPVLLNPERVLEAADAWNRDHAPRHDVPAGESPRLPVPGKDGRLEFLVELAAPRAAATGNGRIDLRNVRAIRAVEKGQPLMRRHPPGKGVPGRDLRGREIPSGDGNDVPLPDSEQVAPDPRDPDVLVAAASGYVEWEDGRLCVRECFVVDGSVDYAVGNIDYARSVVIKGDVQDGFTVRVGGDLEVAGSVGDARLTVGGKVVLHGGFAGIGQGKLSAKGEVQAGFVSNQTVRAYGAITIAKEAFNARLSTRDSLMVKGPLVGGSIMAGLNVTCKSLGNELGTHTEVELGGDYLDHERRAELERTLRELTTALRKIRERMSRIKDQYQKTRKLPALEARLLFALRGKAGAIAAVLPGLETRQGEILERIRQGLLRKGIELKVEWKIHPGAVIKAGNQILRIAEETMGPRIFAYYDDRLHMV